MNEKSHVKAEIEINEGKIQTWVQQWKTHVSNPAVEGTILPYLISKNEAKPFLTNKHYGVVTYIPCKVLMTKSRMGSRGQ